MPIRPETGGRTGLDPQDEGGSGSVRGRASRAGEDARSGPQGSAEPQRRSATGEPAAAEPVAGERAVVEHASGDPATSGSAAPEAPAPEPATREARTAEARMPEPATREPRTAGARTPEPAAPSPQALLETSHLSVRPGPRPGLLARLVRRRRVPPLDPTHGADLVLHEGEALGLVGEPGSGTTALGRGLLGLAGDAHGSVRYRGRELIGVSRRRLRPLRPRLQTVFDGPQLPFTPGSDLRTALLQRLRLHGLAGDESATAALIAQALRRSGLEPAEEYLPRDPAALEEAARHRAELALSLVTEPEILLLGALPGTPGDAGLAGHLRELRRDVGLSYVVTTHDLAAAAAFCDTVAIVHRGRVVESGPAATVCREPLHPYTRALRDGDLAPPTRLFDQVAPYGCAYHPRCPVALDGCGWEARDLLALLERRWLDVAPEEAARERGLIGGIDALEEPHLRKVALAPGTGHDAADVLNYLHGLRQEASAREPREPFWRGVAKLFEDSGRVVVEFYPATAPVLGRAAPSSGGGDAVRVACHLHTRSGT